MIIDADDSIKLDTVQDLLKLMNEHKVDVVQYLLSFTYIDGQCDCLNLLPSHDNARITSEEFLLGLLDDWKYAIFANKLFKTSLLQKIRFYVGKAIDDEFFTYKLISNAKMVYVCNKAFYNYRQRKSSVMNENKQDRLIGDRVDCFVERYEYIKKNKPKLEKRFYEQLSDILLYYKNQVKDEKLKKRIEDLTKVYPYHKPNIIKRLLRKNKKMNSLSMNNEFVLFD